MASRLWDWNGQVTTDPKLAGMHLLASKMLVLSSVARQVDDHAFMLKCLRPLPLLRPAGA